MLETENPFRGKLGPLPKSAGSEPEAGRFVIGLRERKVTETRWILMCKNQSNLIFKSFFFTHCAFYTSLHLIVSYH